MRILVVNGGSSTFKFSLYEVQREFLRTTEPVWTQKVEFQDLGKSRKQAIVEALSDIKDVDGVGHRVVHGGDRFQKPTKITPEVKNEIERLSELAPLHNPINLLGIEISEELYPQASQVAVFDTAFFSSMPEVAWTYPGPWEWREEGIRRYGFHGISHQYSFESVCNELRYCPKRVITCHLGNGASCTAVLDGVAVDTTMGFTPLEGLMMGTRSGSIDPGIILYLMQSKGMSAKDVDTCLNSRSGLLGVGGSFDLRTIREEAARGNARAKLAYELYAYRLKQSIGSLSAVLGGLDVLTFSGGIGENAADLRDKTVAALRYLGDFKTFVFPAREDWMIAKSTNALILSNRPLAS